MKNLNYALKVIVLTIAVALLMTACDDDTNNYRDAMYLGATLEFDGQQVWGQNKTATRVSQVYTDFTKDLYVDVATFRLPGASEGPNFVEQSVGSGKIENGILSFKVEELESGNLLGWLNLSAYFNEWWENGTNAKILPSGTKGNVITVSAFEYGNNNVPDMQNKIGTLNLEKFVGTYVSIGLEWIRFIYVDRDCQITGNPVDDGMMNSNYFYHADTLDLFLREGWNMICKKETYGTYSQKGYAIIEMELKNPSDFRWAIWE